MGLARGTKEGGSSPHYDNASHLHHFGCSGAPSEVHFSGGLNVSRYLHLSKLSSQQKMRSGDCVKLYGHDLQHLPRMTVQHMGIRWSQPSAQLQPNACLPTLRPLTKKIVQKITTILDK